MGDDGRLGSVLDRMLENETVDESDEDEAVDACEGVGDEGRSGPPEGVEAGWARVDAVADPDEEVPTG